MPVLEPPPVVVRPARNDVAELPLHLALPVDDIDIGPVVGEGVDVLGLGVSERVGVAAPGCCVAATDDAVGVADFVVGIPVSVGVPASMLCVLVLVGVAVAGKTVRVSTV